MATASISSRSATSPFIDVESSTRQWDLMPEQMRDALACHDAVLRRHRGTRRPCRRTVGYDFCAAFDAAPAALDSAVASQLALSVND